MENLASLGILFGGIGILFLGSGLFWFVSEYSKKIKSNTSGISRYHTQIRPTAQVHYIQCR
jgi:hypothetical protein